MVKIDIDSAFDLDNRISRFGLMTTYLIVGLVSLTVYALLVAFTVDFKVGYSWVWFLLYTWIFGYNIGVKNIRNWWFVYNYKGVKNDSRNVKLVDKIDRQAKV